MTLRPSILFLALLLLPTLAPAQERWVYVGGNDDVDAFVDKQSLRRTGSKVKAWVRVNYSTPRDSGDSKKKFQSAVSLSMHNCADRTSSTLQVAQYSSIGGTGETVWSMTCEDKPSTYSDVIPETIGEAVLEYVCKATAPKK